MGSLFSVACVTGAGVLPGPAAPVTSAAPVACSSASVLALGVVTPTGAASATGSPCRCECARESPHSERRRRRSSGRERSRSGGKRGKGRSPSPARSAVQIVRLPPLLRLRIQLRGLVRCLLPLLDVQV